MKIEIHDEDEVLCKKLKQDMEEYLKSREIDNYEVRVFSNGKEITEEQPDDYITFKSQKVIYRVLRENIVYVENVNRKIIIHTVDGEYRVSGDIKNWNEKLNYKEFTRTCRSCIVNIKYVCKVSKNNVCLKCENNEKNIYLSRRNYGELKRKFYENFGVNEKKHTKTT